MKTKIPGYIQWKADNYNHLLEQPVQFYALTLTLALIHTHLQTKSDLLSIDTKLAWGYVLLRILHSLVQCTTNTILVRFSIFASSSLVLVAEAFRVGKLLFA